MANQEPDVFVTHKAYPDAKGIFCNSFQSLNEVITDCVVILDTNALLVPYGISKSSLSQIEKTYSSLADANRLVIPGQVAREFAKNRPTKILEIFQALSRKLNGISLGKGQYPLLEEMEEYKKLRDAETKLDKSVDEYRTAIQSLLECIRRWNWNDPVSNLYSKLFPNLVIDPEIDLKTMADQLEYRQANKIPPGYKDSAKDDRGIGDHLVWNTVVSVARDRKCNIVLVSDDSKTDWFHRSENQALFPRYELVDEIRRITNGKSLHIINFSTFLELFGASAKVVGEIRKEELKIDIANVTKHTISKVHEHIEEKVALWLRQHFPFTTVSRISDPIYLGDFVWEEKGGASIIIEVKYIQDVSSVVAVAPRTIEQLESVLSSKTHAYDNYMFFLVLRSEEDVSSCISLVRHVVLNRWNDAQILFGCLMEDGELKVVDPFNVLPTF